MRAAVRATSTAGGDVTLQDLGSIGEFVAALATVLTLVYLAVQIRQNTRTVRASTHHAGSTAWSELVANIAGDPAVSEIYHRGRVSPDSLSKEDARRFDLLCDALLAQIENFYVQYINGHLPRSNQDRFATILRTQFATSGVRLYWSRRRDLFTVEFVRYVEEELGLAPSAQTARGGYVSGAPTATRGSISREGVASDEDA